MGGGSSIDTAKIIAATIKAPDIDWTHWFNTYDSPFGDIAALPASVVPLIAVPTTSGTGSQVTQAAVITDVEQHAKLTLFHPQFFPVEAVIDPELMLTLPPRMTAMTGFDAFSHAFESFTGTRPSPFTTAPTSSSPIRKMSSSTSWLRPGGIRMLRKRCGPGCGFWSERKSSSMKSGSDFKSAWRNTGPGNSSMNPVRTRSTAPSMPHKAIKPCQAAGASLPRQRAPFRISPVGPSRPLAPNRRIVIDKP